MSDAGEHLGQDVLERIKCAANTVPRAMLDHLEQCEACGRRLDALPEPEAVLRLRASAGVPAALANHSRYENLERIGGGGMGVVYKATHRLMKRVVALKVIHPALLAHPGAVERFHQREVRAVAQLNHPNIVAAYDADQAGELHFLVMEYVEGQSLEQIVQQGGPLPARQACEYVRQAALGLQHAHERGMVHRDVKPGNLMLGKDGTVKVLDFGLARLRREEGAEQPAGAAAGSPPAELTQGGLGTPGFMSPEQAADPCSAGIRADIFSLGCTLHFLLHRQVPPATAPEGAAPLPDGLRPVLDRMMARHLNSRYQTAAEVAEALLPFTKEGGALGLNDLAKATALLLFLLALLGALVLYDSPSLRKRLGVFPPREPFALTAYQPSDMLTALDHVKRGQLDEALALFEKARGRGEGYVADFWARAYAARGRARLRVGDVERAKADFTEAVKLHQGLAEAYKGRGDAFAQAGQHAQAAADYSRALDWTHKMWHLPGTVRLGQQEQQQAYEARGDALLALGEPELAWHDYYWAISRREVGKLDAREQGRLYGKRGEAARRQGWLGSALEDFQKAIRLDSKQVGARLGVARVMLERRRPRDAIEACDWVLEKLDINRTEAYLLRGQARLAQGQLFAARSSFKNAVLLAPLDPEAHHGWAQGWERDGSPELAVQRYRRALECDPGHALTHLALARLRATSRWAHVRDGAEALHHAGRARALLGEGHPEALAALAAAHAEAGNFAEAVRWQGQALRLRGRFDLALFARLKRYERGLACREPRAPTWARARR